MIRSQGMPARSLTCLTAMGEGASNRQSTSSSAANRIEGLAQTRDLNAQCVILRLAALIAQQLFDQPIAGDDAVRAQQQQRKQRALLRAANPHRHTVHQDLEWDQASGISGGWRPRPFERIVLQPPCLRQRWVAVPKLRRSCVEDRIDAELALGRHAQLVPELEALTAEYPFRERG